VKTWKIGTPKADVPELPTQRNWVTGLASSADGKTLVASGYDRTVRFFDAAKKSETHGLGGFTTTVWCVALSGDGKLLAAGGAADSTGKIPSIRVFQVADQKELFPVERPDSKAVALNPLWTPPKPEPAPAAEEKKPEEKKPAAEEKKPEAKKPEAKKPDEKKPEPKKEEPKKPEPAKKPEVKKPEPEKKPAAAAKPQAKPAADAKKDDAKKPDDKKK
jgi:outer membrane biosynthesis protein TonB